MSVDDRIQRKLVGMLRDVSALRGLPTKGDLRTVVFGWLLFALLVVAGFVVVEISRRGMLSALEMAVS